jgi:hypothetical protein
MRALKEELVLKIPNVKIGIGNQHPRCGISCKFQWADSCAINETNKIMAFKKGNNNNFPKWIVVTSEFEGDVLSDVVQRVVRSSRHHWEGGGICGGGGG